MALHVDITKEHPQFTLQVSFSAENQPLGILGASGSGKSMTLRCIAGLDTPTGGQIVLNNRILFDSKTGLNLPARERNMGFLFQNYALFPHMTVLQNICFGLNGIAKAEQFRKAKEKIAMARLEGLEDRYPYQLSGGQQQRVALARAWVLEPEALLLDEPFSALDNHLRSQMEKELMEVLAEYKGTTLFVTHNLEESYRVCRNLIILDQGTKIACGGKDEIFKRPPTYTAAQLTGCKNLSRARAVSPDTVAALDWNCTLKVAQSMPKHLTHIGIRAHHLTFVKDSDLLNIIPCWIAQTNESPHRMSLYLSLNSPPKNPNSYHLQVEVYKEKWELIKDCPFPWHVYLNPERLFLTGGQ